MMGFEHLLVMKMPAWGWIRQVVPLHRHHYALNDSSLLHLYSRRRRAF